MGTARTRLNVAYSHGALFVSVVFGPVTESWVISWIALAVTIGGVYGGEIRPTAGRR